MSERETINKYLKSLKKYLARLESSDANEVIKEIESHIFDVIEAREQNGEEVHLQNLLDGFGSPRELASQYVDHILTGSPPPKGFKTIQKIKKTVSKGIWFSMAFFGYSIALILALLGVLKIIYPDEIGVWVAEHGHSLVISFDQYVLPDTREIMGWWLVPVSLILSVLIALLTRKVLKLLASFV